MKEKEEMREREKKLQETPRIKKEGGGTREEERHYPLGAGCRTGQMQVSKEQLPFQCAHLRSWRTFQS